MEGVSTSIHNGQRIHIFDFTNCGETLEKTLNLIKAIGDEFETNPKNSVLALINVNNAYFHFETLKAFKVMRERTSPFEKKVAIIGLKGLQKVGFNTVTSSQKNNIKVFDSELEAKEWLTIP